MRRRPYLLLVLLLALGIIAAGHADLKAAFVRPATLETGFQALTGTDFSGPAAPERKPVPPVPDLIFFNSIAYYPWLWYLMPLTSYQRQSHGLVRKGHGGVFTGVACSLKSTLFDRSRLSFFIFTSGNLFSLSPPGLILRL